MYTKEYYSYLRKSKKQNLLFGILSIVILLSLAIISLISAKRMNEFLVRFIVSTLFVLAAFICIFICFKNQLYKSKLNHCFETLNAKKETIVDKVIGVENDFTLSKYVRVKELFLKSGQIIYLNAEKTQDNIDVGMRIEAIVANNFAIDIKVVGQ